LSVSAPIHCSCNLSQPVTAAGGESVCGKCGLLLAQKLAQKNDTRGADRAIIPPRLVEQARWQIKMHQRMIAELRQTFGIQE
jgi:hypothetical protein